MCSVLSSIYYINKSKDKIHRKTGHEGPEEE